MFVSISMKFDILIDLFVLNSIKLSSLFRHCEEERRSNPLSYKKITYGEIASLSCFTIARNDELTKCL